MESHTLQIHIGNLEDVLLVLATHHDVRDTGSFGSQDLFLDTAHRQHLATQRDLTRHRRILAHLTLGEGRGNRGGDGDTG